MADKRATNSLLLQVEDLATGFRTEKGPLRAVDGVSFTLERGTIMGLVGESGCGKSVTALSIMRLLPKPAGFIEKGRILFKGTDLLRLPPEKMQKMRGARIAMIFQEPMTALNPVHRLGRQLLEIFALHRPEMSPEQRYRKALELFRQVGIPAPEQRMEEYPHQISGGMRQRVMIAMALACEPDLLIADEPTTALDVTIQAQILELIMQLQSRTQMAVLFITHDLGVIAEICDHVQVMYAGTVAESATVKELFANPLHPYTRGLLQAIPRLDTPAKQPLPIIEGSVPSLDDLPPGCRFVNRCPRAFDRCRQTRPLLRELEDGRRVACHLYAGRGRANNGQEAP